MMCDDAVGVWHPAWRLWEAPLKPGWTREMEAMLDLWGANGRTATPQELGVPPELRALCDIEASEAKNAMLERNAA